MGLNEINGRPWTGRDRLNGLAPGYVSRSNVPRLRERVHGHGYRLWDRHSSISMRGRVFSD